jgi:glucose-1-phosphatase
MNDKIKKIENFLIDFGGVLYKIDENRPVINFERFTKNKKDFKENIIRKIYSDEILMDFQKGKIKSTVFRNELRHRLSIECSDEEFDGAWNSLLISPYPNSINYLKTLKKHGRIFLISNTNEIHYNHFHTECAELFKEFERCYFSHFTGLHKPETTFYQLVINENKLNKTKTILIDDSSINIKSAEEYGLMTYLIKNKGLKEFIYSFDI